MLSNVAATFLCSLMLLKLFCVRLPFRAVTKELGMMADRIVALEKERDELQEGARWRGQVR